MILDWLKRDELHIEPRDKVISSDIPYGYDIEMWSKESLNYVMNHCKRNEPFTLSNIGRWCFADLYNALLQYEFYGSWFRTNLCFAYLHPTQPKQNRFYSAYGIWVYVTDGNTDFDDTYNLFFKFSGV